MATVHFRNAKIFVGGYEITGDSASVEVSHSAEILDETTFGDSTRIHKGGLTTTDVSVDGHWSASAGSVDRVVFGIVGTDDQLVTVFANGITEGTSTDKGFAMKGVVSEYNIGGSVGALMPFNAAIMGRGIEA